MTELVPVWECVSCMVGITLLNAWAACRVIKRQSNQHIADIKRIGEIAGEMTTKLAAENTEKLKCYGVAWNGARGCGMRGMRKIKAPGSVSTRPLPHG